MQAGVHLCCWIKADLSITHTSHFHISHFLGKFVNMTMTMSLVLDCVGFPIHINLRVHFESSAEEIRCVFDDIC